MADSQRQVFLTQQVDFMREDEILMILDWDRLLRSAEMRRSNTEPATEGSREVALMLVPYKA